MRGSSVFKSLIAWTASQFTFLCSFLLACVALWPWTQISISDCFLGKPTLAGGRRLDFTRPTQSPPPCQPHLPSPRLCVELELLFNSKIFPIKCFISGLLIFILPLLGGCSICKCFRELECRSKPPLSTCFYFCHFCMLSLWKLDHWTFKNSILTVTYSDTTHKRNPSSRMAGPAEPSHRY